VATRDSVERMNIRTARYDQLNLFLLQITAKTRELGGARAVLIAHGTAPNAGRIRLIDKTLGDLATVERMVVNEMLRRYRLGGWTHAYPVSTQRPRAPMRQLSSQTSGLVLLTRYDAHGGDPSPSERCRNLPRRRPSAYDGARCHTDQ
jgi:hypothetical protein